MEYTCTICTDYIDTSKKEEVLRNVTRIVTEALLTKDKEESDGKRKIYDR